MSNLWQNYIYQRLKRKSKFWMMSSRLWDDLWPHPTTVFSLSGKKSLVAREWNGQNGTPNNFTEICLHHNILHQGVALNTLTMFWADRVQDSDRMRRGGLFVYAIDAWCSNSGTWCFNVNMLTILWSPSCCGIHPNREVGCWCSCSGERMWQSSEKVHLKPYVQAGLLFNWVGHGRQ